MSRDNLDSMRTPNVATGRLPGLRELGIVPATMDSVVPEYLGEGYGYDRFNLWRGQHGG
jgi:NADH dehydrogenase